MRRRSQPAIDRHAQHRQHRDQKHRQRKGGGDPEPPGQAAEFGIVIPRVELQGFRLQVHAALWAGAGADLLDLRVHRAGVDGIGAAGRCVGCRAVRPAAGRRHRKELSGHELPAAALGAEVENDAVAKCACGGLLVDGHAADGIDGHDLKGLRVGSLAYLADVKVLVPASVETFSGGGSLRRSAVSIPLREVDRLMDVVASTKEGGGRRSSPAAQDTHAEQASGATCRSIRSRSIPPARPSRRQSGTRQHSSRRCNSCTRSCPCRSTRSTHTCRSQHAGR